ncbi:MAG: DUF5908 family protein [Terracidiphilus sp.]|jgi:hypothetical protein
MAIEIRQLTVKSSVSSQEKKEKPSFSQQDRDRLKREILSECRQMLFEMMRLQRER